jgi:hypothetical protein
MKITITCDSRRLFTAGLILGFGAIVAVRGSFLLAGL